MSVVSTMRFLDQCSLRALMGLRRKVWYVFLMFCWYIEKHYKRRTRFLTTNIHARTKYDPPRPLLENSSLTDLGDGKTAVAV
jgi:hypothetical protein